MNNCCNNNVYYEDDMKRWESCPSTALANADNYYTKHQIDEMLEDIETSGTCECDYEWIEDELSKKLDASAYTPVDLSDYALKTDIPTSNSALTNDAGYLTEHQPLKTINNISLVGTGNIEIGSGSSVDLSDYWTSAQTQSAITSSVSGKTDNSSFTAHTADTTVHITSTERNTWNNKANVWCGTEQQYNNLQSKDNNTIYLIY